MAKKLAVFDFDRTVVDETADDVAKKLLKNEHIPESVLALYKNTGWIVHMQEIFKLLKKHNISKEVVMNAIVNIPAVPGIKKLISDLATTLMYDVIIISDSNTLFIDQWLRANDMKQYIHTVFTNPAQYNDEGLLEVKEYHIQKCCDRSTVNLCKGSIMEDFLKQQKTKNIIYDHIIYVGDGEHDFCPVLRLKEGDIACARDGFALHGIMKKNKNEHAHEKILAKVCVWKDGQDILNFISS